MDPLTQRLITVLAGIAAGWLVQHVPGLDQPTANELSGVLISFAIGWATKHFADVQLQAQAQAVGAQAAALDQKKVV